MIGQHRENTLVLAAESLERLTDFTASRLGGASDFSATPRHARYSTTLINCTRSEFDLSIASLMELVRSDRYVWSYAEKLTHDCTSYRTVR